MLSFGISPNLKGILTKTTLKQYYVLKEYKDNYEVFNHFI